MTKNSCLNTKTVNKKYERNFDLKAWSLSWNMKNLREKKQKKQRKKNNFLLRGKFCEFEEKIFSGLNEKWRMMCVEKPIYPKWNIERDTINTN